MTKTTTPACSRIQVINHVTGSTTFLETRRDRSLVWFDLARLVRCVNCSCTSVKASFHLSPDLIVLQLHCDGCRLSDRAKIKEVVEQVNQEMLSCVKTLVYWEGGQQV
jgi:hypothetical protein